MATLPLYVPRKQDLHLRVLDERGGVVFLAGVSAPGERAAEVRVDPNVATTAAALVSRARPDLAKAARNGGAVMTPLYAAISQALHLKVGDHVVAAPASSDATPEPEPAAAPVSVDSSPTVADAVAQVLPALETQAPAPPEQVESPPFLVGVQAFGEDGRLVAALAFPVGPATGTDTDGARAPSATVVQSSTVNAASTTLPGPSPSVEPSPAPSVPMTGETDFKPYAEPPYPILHGPTPGSENRGPDPPMALSGGITLFRQTWDWQWFDLTTAGAWNASDWDMRAYASIQGMGTPMTPGECVTTTTRLNVVCPNPQFNTSTLGTLVTDEIVVTNCSEQQPDGTFQPRCYITLNTYLGNGRFLSHVVPGASNVFVTQVRLVFSSRGPEGTAPDRRRQFLGTWGFFSERLDKGQPNWLRLHSASTMLRDFDLKMVQDPDPYVPDDDSPSPQPTPKFRFVPVTYPAAPPWSVGDLDVNGPVAFRDARTGAVVATRQATASGPVPPEGLEFLAWDFTGTPPAVAAAPWVQSDATEPPPAPSPTPSGQLPEGEYIPDFHQVVAFAPGAAITPYRGIGRAIFGGPVLEVIDPVENRLLASSKSDPSLTFDPVLLNEGLNPDKEGQQVRQFRLQNRVFLANTRDVRADGQSYLHDRFRIRLRNLNCDDDSIPVAVRLKIAAREVTHNLRRKSETIWSVDVVKPDLTSPSSTTFTSACTLKDASQADFSEQMRKAHIQLGQLLPGGFIGIEKLFGLSMGEFDLLDRAMPYTPNIRAAGHDMARVSAQAGSESLSVYLRVKSQASISQLFIHGHHNSGVLTNEATGEFIRPMSDVRPTDWAFDPSGRPAPLRTQILTACSVVDINDHHQVFTDGPGLPAFSPGYDWDAIMGGGKRMYCLAGFNAEMRVEPSTLGAFARLGIRPDDPEATAKRWLRANYDTRVGAAYFWMASAITSGGADGGGYYFITKDPTWLWIPTNNEFRWAWTHVGKRLPRRDASGNFIWRTGNRPSQIERSRKVEYYPLRYR